VKSDLCKSYGGYYGWYCKEKVDEEKGKKEESNAPFENQGGSQEIGRCGEEAA
jgi:hypothetical protein